jgi:hypothetical protein
VTGVTLKKKRPLKKLWVHASGGCWVAGPKRGLCDDEYRHEETGQRLTMRTTVQRHFDMPRRVSGPAELRRLSGVSRLREKKVVR